MAEYELDFLHVVDGHIEAIDGATECFEAPNDGTARDEAQKYLAACRRKWPDTYGADLHADPEGNPRKVGTLT